MTKEERQERSLRLGALLNAPPLLEIPANQLGKATYAWLRSSKAAKPYDSHEGAAQTFNLLRKGQTIGDVNIERTEAFLDAIEGDPKEWVTTWVERNGHLPAASGTPSGPRDPAPELVISEETQQALQGAFGQVKLLYDQKKNELAREEERLYQLRAEVRQMEHALKAVGLMPREKRNGTPGRRPAASQEKPKTKGSHVSEETAMKILEEIKGYVASNPPALEDVPGSFTRPAVEKALGRHHSQIGSAIEVLREKGLVRAAGLTTNEKGRRMNVWAVVA